LRVNPIKGFAALEGLYPDGKRLIVLSDLHFGITAAAGVKRPTPEEEVEESLQTIDRMTKEMSVKGIVLLGDLKHGLYRPSLYEKKALKSFSRGLSERSDVWFVKGNHDYEVEEFLNSRVAQVGSTGLEIDKTLFLHGHSLPRRGRPLESYDRIVSGHIHPQVFLNGEWVPVWLILRNIKENKPEEVVVLPHFSRYASKIGYRPGSPVTTTPYMRKLRLEEYEYTMLDISLKLVSQGPAKRAVF
jgi:metallophosphoesterase superfamily enzyme